ncbi:MAG TPA: hypothetical protein VK138_15805, partial [Acidiferrobacterales bacterium]|nr:hypothetical protein [Acidiferrobacterales bacterium]
RWTFLPPSGPATEGRPRLSSAAGKRSAESAAIFSIMQVIEKMKKNENHAFRFSSLKKSWMTFSELP